MFVQLFLISLHPWKVREQKLQLPVT